MIFILFDVEAIFLYRGGPTKWWGGGGGMGGRSCIVGFRWEMLLVLGEILHGGYFISGKRALEWNAQPYAVTRVRDDTPDLKKIRMSARIRAWRPDAMWGPN